MAVILIVEDDVFIREVAEMLIQRLRPSDTYRLRCRRGAYIPALAPTHRCAVYRYLFENFGPRRVRPSASGHRVAAEFASALHDRQYRYRQDEHSADQRHAHPSQAIHATSAPERNRRIARRLVLKKCPLWQNWTCTSMPCAIAQDAQRTGCRPIQRSLCRCCRLMRRQSMQHFETPPNEVCADR
jgi:hypothetical protein